MRGLFAFALVLLTASTVWAQSCLPMAALDGFLAQFGEHPHFTGEREDGQRRLMLAFNPERGSWSVFVLSDELVCLMASGIRGTIVPLGDPL